jgi:FAD/FMN-containing dehydrogenase
VVDVGRHLNRIVATDAKARRVRVQPGVVRNELNLALKPHNLFFTPETSTANRAMVGGMVGNNSCGANSIVHGTTREHLVSTRGFLSDGSEVTFGPLTKAQFEAKCAGPDTLETRIYRTVRDLLGDAKNRQLIRDNYPKPTVTRRNTGYALDGLMECNVFDPASDQPFNLCQLLAGSEGTLFLGVEFELNVEPLPPAGALMCAHFATIQDSLNATLIAMRHRPFGCELIDRHILECTKANLEQAKNRFFVVGDPGAVLVIEIRLEKREAIEAVMRTIESELRAAGLGYAFPVLWGEDANKRLGPPPRRPGPHDERPRRRQAARGRRGHGRGRRGPAGLHRRVRPVDAREIRHQLRLLRPRRRRRAAHPPALRPEDARGHEVLPRHRDRRRAPREEIPRLALRRARATAACAASSSPSWSDPSASP